MQPYNRLTINLSAVRYNIEAVQARLHTKGRVMPMVKASAYGTEALFMTQFLKTCGTEIVGVSHVREGIELRQKGCDLSIFSIWAALFEAKSVVDYDLEVSISDLNFCHALNKEAIKEGKQVKVHLDIDTGMHRFGMPPENAVAFAKEISTLPGISLEGIMTHFVAAENPHFDTLSKRQVEVFHKAVHDLSNCGISPPWIHAANSASIIRFPLPFCNMVRLGAATFGLYSSDSEKQQLTLRPALSLESCIVAINECAEGQTIGYSQSYTVKRKQERIAILPIGYHDGFHIHTSGKGCVLIHGKKAPYVGRICMDFMMVDITDIPEATIGDPVLIFGKDSRNHSLAIEEVAKNSQTNVREVVACLGTRVERQFVHDPALIPLRSLYISEVPTQELTY